MKICLVRMMPYPFTMGGGTTYIKELSKALIREGNEVYVISAKPESSEEISRVEGARNYNIGINHNRFSGKLWKVPFEGLRRIAFEFSFMISSYRLIKKINPDIIHCQTALTESLPFAITGKPFIITEHGIHTEYMKEFYKRKKNYLSGIGIWIYGLIERFNIKRAKKVICMNQETKDYYSKIAEKNKFILMDNGLDVLSIHSKPKSKPILFSLSRLSEQKGLDYLLDALVIIDKKVPVFEFTIAGDGDRDYVEKLNKKASKLKNIKIKFVGLVQGKTKEDLLNRGSIFIIPSLYEGFPATLIEAMSHNCAVIASDCGGLINIVKNSFGILVPFSNETKRAENLAKAIESSLKWNIKKMGENARKESEKYDYRDLVKRYIQIYEEVVVKNNGKYISKQ